MTNNDSNNCPPGNYQINIYNNTGKPATVKGVSKFDQQSSMYCREGSCPIPSMGKPIILQCSTEKLTFSSDDFTATYDPVSAEYTFSSSNDNLITSYWVQVATRDPSIIHNMKTYVGTILPGPNPHWLMDANFMNPKYIAPSMFYLNFWMPCSP